MAVLSKAMLAALVALFAALVALAAPAPIERRELGTRAVVNGEVHYVWEIDAAEMERLSRLLGTDFSRFGLRATRLDGPKSQCVGCGKLSGFDDFVHNALADGVHTKDFIIKVIEAEKHENPSPPHELRCMNCDISYKEKRSAAGVTDSIKELAKRRWTEAVGWADFDKRSEDVDIVAKRGWAVGFNWAINNDKRSENEDPVAKRGWATGFNWAINNDKRSEDEDPIAKRGWATGFN